MTENRNPGVLIIGGGNGGKALLNMLRNEHLARVSGIVDENPDAPALQLARQFGVRVYSTLDQALSECGSCLTFNVTGDAAVDMELRSRGHAGGIIGGTEAFLIWGMVERMHEMRVKLEYQADRDPLTGIFNRRYMMERLAQGIAEFSRYDMSYSAAMLDIDRFKEINDRYGHAAGDKALSMIVSILKAELRGADILGRAGGDEFLILMPHCGHIQATTATQRCLDTLKSRPIELDSMHRIQVTFSAGICSFERMWKKAGNQEAANIFLARLDENLYQAKSAGRARIASDTNQTSGIAL